MDMFSLVWLALAILTGTWSALLASRAVTRRLARTNLSALTSAGQIGAAAMALPGFWLSVFVGAPFFGGMAIEAAGSRGMRWGALLGAGVTQFVCVVLGSAAGVLLALAYSRMARRPGADR